MKSPEIDELYDLAAKRLSPQEIKLEREARHVYRDFKELNSFIVAKFPQKRGVGRIDASEMDWADSQLPTLVKLFLRAEHDRSSTGMTLAIEATKFSGIDDIAIQVVRNERVDSYVSVYAGPPGFNILFADASSSVGVAPAQVANQELEAIYRGQSFLSKAEASVILARGIVDFAIQNTKVTLQHQP